MLKINITQPGKRPLRLRLPRALLFNRVTLGCLLPAYTDKNELPFTPEQILLLAKAAGKYARRHKHWRLLEVSSASGAHIEIII